MIDYVFNYLHLEKLNCEVIEYNDTVVRLHEKFGFKQEGFRESNIIKDDKRFGVYYFGLTKEKWMLTRECLKNKYYKLFLNTRLIFINRLIFGVINESNYYCRT